MEKKTDKKFIFTIVLFVVVLAIAATAFSAGFMQLTRQEAGISVIEEYPDSDAGLYAQDFELYYNLQGKQSDIKAVKKALSELFSTKLLHLYKLTDPEKEYEEMTNLATINHNPGQAVKIDETLYYMLKRACELSDESVYAGSEAPESSGLNVKKGYSIFSGAFYKTFNALIYADDYLEQDPVVNDENHNMVAALLDSALDIDNEIIFNDASSEVTLILSDDIKNSDYMEDMPVLDLNYLRNAFISKEIVAYLSDKGYNDGYLITKDGLTLMLRNYKDGRYVLNDAGGVNQEVYIEAGSCSATVNNFVTGASEAGEYEINRTDGAEYVRTPNILFNDIGLNDTVTSAMSVSESGDAVNAKFSVMMFMTRANNTANEELAEELENKFNTKLYYIEKQ